MTRDCLSTARYYESGRGQSCRKTAFPRIGESQQAEAADQSRPTKRFLVILSSQLNELRERQPDHEQDPQGYGGFGFGLQWKRFRDGSNWYRSGSKLIYKELILLGAGLRVVGR